MAFIPQGLQSEVIIQEPVGERRYQEIYAQSAIQVVEPKTLGSLIGKEDELLTAIIRCESDWDPSADNPISTAYGLGQFVDSTWAYVQKKWGMVLDRNDPEDQLYATERLLAEEGVRHWEESRFCWQT